MCFRNYDYRKWKPTAHDWAKTKPSSGFRRRRDPHEQDTFSYTFARSPRCVIGNCETVTTYISNSTNSTFQDRRKRMWKTTIPCWWWMLKTRLCISFFCQNAPMSSRLIFRRRTTSLMSNFAPSLMVWNGSANERCIHHPWRIRLRKRSCQCLGHEV